MFPRLSASVGGELCIYIHKTIEWFGLEGTL